MVDLLRYVTRILEIKYKNQIKEIEIKPFWELWVLLGAKIWNNKIKIRVIYGIIILFWGQNYMIIILLVFLWDLSYVNTKNKTIYWSYFLIKYFNTSCVRVGDSRVRLGYPNGLTRLDPINKKKQNEGNSFRSLKLFKNSH